MATLTLAGLIATWTAGTVMTADAALDPSATEAAVMVTVKLVEGGLGAVYVVGTPLGVDAGERLPHCCVGHVTVQLTPLPAESPVTDAVSCAEVPGATVVLEGVTRTETGVGAGAGVELAAHPARIGKAHCKSRNAFFISHPGTKFLPFLDPGPERRAEERGRKTENCRALKTRPRWAGGCGPSLLG